MKITKSELKEIIREVLNDLKEDASGLPSNMAYLSKFSPKKAGSISTQQYALNKQIIRKLKADADSHPLATDNKGKYLHKNKKKKKIVTKTNK